jgi:hypothetical protein
MSNSKLLARVCLIISQGYDYILGIIKGFK